MATTHRAADWDRYTMVYDDPHRSLEPAEQEEAIVDAALQDLAAAGILAAVEYDREQFLKHRRAVKDMFEIPWTAITPRMQRLIWAINAVRRPQIMIAAGVFCGNTFISNAGAAVGPGAVYAARELIGIEVKPDEAARAERNVRRIDPSGVARVVAADAVEFVTTYPENIELLYLDADGDKGRGKGIYLEITEACLDRLPKGALVLAHNSINAADRLADYLAYVRDAAHFAASVNVAIDGEGLEVSVR